MPCDPTGAGQTLRIIRRNDEEEEEGEEGAMAARGRGRPAGREPQDMASVVFSTIALAMLLFLSTFLPHDTSGVVSGGRPRGEETAPPSRAAKPPHIVLVIVGACLGILGGHVFMCGETVLTPRF